MPSIFTVPFLPRLKVESVTVESVVIVKLEMSAVPSPIVKGEEILTVSIAVNSNVESALVFLKLTPLILTVLFAFSK